MLLLHLFVHLLLAAKKFTLLVKSNFNEDCFFLLSNIGEYSIVKFKK